jgi:hypothetical protein
MNKEKGKIYASYIDLAGVDGMLVCDGRCDKAWGMKYRPSVKRLKKPTKLYHYDWLSDNELGIAPEDCSITIFEIKDFHKPKNSGSEIIHNDWCRRGGCERPSIVTLFERSQGKKIRLPDFRRRIPVLSNPTVVVNQNSVTIVPFESPQT